MYIRTDDARFVPKNFVINVFYGVKTCFCWDAEKLVIFPYVSDDIASVQVLTAPSTIKQIQCYSGRIFLICIPQGIYKLSKDRELAVLSKSGAGMGTVFYEILMFRNNYVCLYNKQKMTYMQLFPSSFVGHGSKNICVYPLDTASTEERFLKVIRDGEPENNFCLIGYEKKLFKLENDRVQIIYSGMYFISDIVPVWMNSKIAGILLVTDKDAVVIIYSKNDKLLFEKVCLGSKVQAICASFSQQAEDTMWIVYSDESKLYYVKKQLSVDEIQRRRVQDKSFICLQCYDSRVILGLTSNSQLVEFSTSTVEKTLSMENDTFINLHSEMLTGTDFIINQICAEARNLQLLNEKLIGEEEKLKRINLYAHKQTLRACPKILVLWILNQRFLRANFYNILPKNSHIVFCLESEFQTIFSMKKVTSSEVLVETSISENVASRPTKIAIDLVTLRKEGTPWCLIRNYINDPLFERKKKSKSRNDKSNFINAKISMLRSFLAEGNVDMGKLSEMKKSIRKEIGDARNLIDGTIQS